MKQTSSAQAKALDRSNRKVATSAAMMAVLMIGAAYAAVPLYDLFCRVTGFGGTTQVAQAAPGVASERIVTIRFDATVNRKMPWDFAAPIDPIAVKVGESGLAFYRAHNLTDQTITGTATYNVSPAKVGIYFSKIDCFCFTEQVLAPGQSVDMPVSFFVDPDILTDREMDDVKTITLSYTFFKAQQETSAVISSPKG
ncbi:cytochrome c oxidase assembly protein [Alphaproteobacteria bacterium]|nr:cytochrome c oxidase assembly protein [Alphaproteobacteria bacterium]